MGVEGVLLRGEGDLEDGAAQEMGGEGVAGLVPGAFVGGHASRVALGRRRGRPFDPRPSAPTTIPPPPEDIYGFAID